MTDYNPKAVLFFQTEEQRADFDQIVLKALKRANRGTPPDWFKCITLREFTPSQRRALLKYYIEKYFNEFNGIYIVIIDQVADFVEDPNDGKRSFSFINTLGAYADKFNCCFVLVLHFNPGSDVKGRGHIGSELERKAYAVIDLKKPNLEADYSIISPRALRKAGNFTPIKFKFNNDLGYFIKDGLHLKLTQEEKEEAKQQQKFILLYDIIYSIYLNPDEPQSYTDLVNNISMKRNIKERQAKNLIREMTDLRIIEQNEDKLYIPIKRNLDE